MVFRMLRNGALKPLVRVREPHRTRPPVGFCILHRDSQPGSLADSRRTLQGDGCVSHHRQNSHHYVPTTMDMIRYLTYPSRTTRLMAFSLAGPEKKARSAANGQRKAPSPAPRASTWTGISLGYRREKASRKHLEGWDYLPEAAMIYSNSWMNGRLSPRGRQGIRI